MVREGGENHKPESQHVFQNVYQNNDEKDAIHYYKDLQPLELAVVYRSYSVFEKCWEVP